MMTSRIPYGLVLLLLMSLVLYTACDEDDATPVCESDTVFADTCVTYSIDELVVMEQGDQFVVTNSTNFTIDFERLDEAQAALEIIEYYSFNEYCIIGKDTTFSYFLSDGEIPTVDFEGGEDCLGNELCNLQVRLTSSGKYTVVEPVSVGEKWLYSSESQDTAHQILQTILFFQPTERCYIGRPNTKMHYLKK